MVARSVDTVYCLWNSLAPDCACRPGTLRPERLSRFLRENSYPHCPKFRCPDLAYKSKEGEFMFFVFFDSVVTANDSPELCEERSYSFHALLFGPTAKGGAKPKSRSQVKLKSQCCKRRGKLLVTICQGI